MSENTVRKYIRQLEEQELLFTEPTEIMTRAGQKRNRNLHHTLRPTQEVVNAYYDRQLARLEITVMRQKAAAAQAGMGPPGPLCAEVTAWAGYRHSVWGLCAAAPVID